MHVTQKQLEPTKVELTITADPPLLAEVKRQTVARLAADVRVAGFRAGKAPAHLAERQLDQSVLQSEALDVAVNRLYVAAVEHQNLRPIAQPDVAIIKFVPFTTLEFTATVDVVGAIKLPSYKDNKAQKPSVNITSKDIDEVVERLRQREAAKKDVSRASQSGDEITIGFDGRDAGTKEPINGASGKDYPLLLGSNSFIPGFEPELIGLKAGQDKTFTIDFPKDYGVAALQKRAVAFTVTVKKVCAVSLPKPDDAFAATIGSFKSVAELKADIKKQLRAEREQQRDREFENQLLQTIAEQATVAIPPLLIDQQIAQLEREERQNLTYRGQTWQEHLEAENITEVQHRERNRPAAESQVKAGLVLSAIAEAENLQVSAAELDAHIQKLKQQYSDPAMRAELDKPENRREIMSRILTEKTLAKLTGYAA